ncbi:MAG: NUDIX domain-containing protein, partial [Phenylobacterium sp.]
MPQTPPNTADIKPAATILLLRDDPSFEVLMVKRHHQIDFASGALVFPGGKSHAGDHDPNWEIHTVGWEAYDADQRAMRIAAIREVFEEAGILLARRRDGQPMS